MEDAHGENGRRSSGSGASARRAALVTAAAAIALGPQTRASAAPSPSSLHTPSLSHTRSEGSFVGRTVDSPLIKNRILERFPLARKQHESPTHGAGATCRKRRGVWFDSQAGRHGEGQGLRRSPQAFAAPKQFAKPSVSPFRRSQGRLPAGFREERMVSRREVRMARGRDPNPSSFGKVGADGDGSDKGRMVSAPGGVGAREEIGAATGPGASPRTRLMSARVTVGHHPRQQDEQQHQRQPELVRQRQEQELRRHRVGEKAEPEPGSCTVASTTPPPYPTGDASRPRSSDVDDDSGETRSPDQRQGAARGGDGNHHGDDRRAIADGQVANESVARPSAGIPRRARKKYHGVRSGGTLSGAMRPVLDELDYAKGHAASGAAAMKILRMAEEVGWRDIRFSALRLGKLAAGAASAGCWTSHGRVLLQRMRHLGVRTEDISSWTAVILGLSRSGHADECIEVLGAMARNVGLRPVVREGEADTVEVGVPGVVGEIEPDAELERGDKDSPGGGATAAAAGGEEIGSSTGDKRATLSAIRQRQDYLDRQERELQLGAVTIAHNHCMFAFIKAGRLQEAVEHFEQFFRRTTPGVEDMELMGDDWAKLALQPQPSSLLPPDLFSYTHLLSALEKLGYDRLCLAALEEMKTRGIKADTYTYASAIKALGSKGQWKQAVSLLHELRDEIGVAPDVYVYTAAMSACAAEGQWEAALSLEEDMRRHRVEHNAYTLTSCISALANAGRWEQAVERLRAAEEEGIQVSTPAYNAALKAFAAGKALEPGLLFLKSMREEGRIPLDEQTHNIAIELCKECGDTAGAVAILEEMRDHGRPPSVVSYNTALGASEASGDHRLALRLLQRMTEVDGLKPDVWSYNIILATCATAGEWSAVDEILGKMDAIAIKDFHGKGASANVRRQSSANDRRYASASSRNFITFASLIIAADAGGHAVRCLEYYAEMGRWGLSPNSAVFDAVARSCIASRSWRWAMLVHKDASYRGAAGSWTAASAAVAHLIAGKADEADRILRAAERQGHLKMDVDGQEDFSPLCSLAGKAATVMGKVGEWEGVARMFDGVVKYVTPTTHMKVMYLTAQAALASSGEGEKGKGNDVAGMTDRLADDRADPALKLDIESELLMQASSEREMEAEAETGTGPWSVLWNCPGRAATEALHALERLEGMGLEVGPREHTAVLLACSGEGAASAAVKVLRKIREKGLRCSQSAAAGALTAACRRKDWTGAAVIADELALAAVQPTAYSATAAITAYGRVGRAGDALDLMERLLDGQGGSEALTTTVFNAAITACSRVGALEDGMFLLREMWERDVARDVWTYNAAVSLCKKAGEWTRAVGLLEAMEVEGVAPDIVTFNTVIAACEAGADHWTAFSLFNQIERAGLSPDLWTYNSLAKVLGSCGHWERALALLADMRKRGIDPDVVTYTAVIGACHKSGEVGTALGLLQDMTSRGIEANERTFSALIKAVASADNWRTTCGDSDVGNWSKVVNLHEEAKRRGLANVVTYSVAMSSCAREKRWESALALLDEMRENGIEPNDYTYAAAMWACVNGENGKRALQLFATVMNDSRMAWTPASGSSDAAKRKGQRPGGDLDSPEGVRGVQEGRFGKQGGRGAVTGRSRQCYMAAITACHKEGDFLRAFALLQHMRRKGVKASLGLYNLVLSLCQRHGDAETSKKILRMMRSDRVAPSVVSCNQVIRTCEKAGRWKDALAILRAMLSGGVRPNVYTVCSVLRACCISVSPRRSVELLEELRQHMGAALGLPVYNNLIYSFHREGRYHLADFFYKMAYREGAIRHWQGQSEGRATQGVPTADGDSGAVSQNHERVMDLHGHSLSLAHAAVRHALEEIWRASQLEGTSVGDLTIVTGVAKGDSLHAFHPVVRSEVQSMLMEEFYPPMSSVTKAGNPGCIIVGADTIQAWLMHNMEAKRPVMARLASTIKKQAEVRRSTAEGEEAAAVVDISTEGVEDGDDGSRPSGATLMEDLAVDVAEELAEDLESDGNSA